MWPTTSAMSSRGLWTVWSSCLFVDYAAERQFMLMAATMQAEAQAAFNHEMQRRQAAAGKLLIPAGAAMPQPGMNGGSRA